MSDKGMTDMDVKFTKEQVAAMNAFVLATSALLKSDEILNNGANLTAMLVALGHIVGFAAHSANDPVKAYNLVIGAAEFHRKQLADEETGTPDPERVMIPVKHTGTIH